MSPAGGRVTGVDAARAVALVGMFSVHILPLTTRAGGETLAAAVASGRSSALFAVLAGVGIALGTGGAGRVPAGRPHVAAGAGLVVRGVLVGLLGLWLAGLGPPVAVILAYYGLLFVLAAPLLRLPAGALAAGAAAMCVLGPVVSHLVRSGLPPGPGPQADLAMLAQPGRLLTTLTLTGYYPVLPWTTYLLAGMAVGRLDLRRARTAAALLVGGAGLATAAAGGSAALLGPAGGATVLGERALAEPRYGTVPTETWWWLAVDLPHSGTPLDLAHTTGTGLAVLGAMLLLARWARPVVWVPAAVGAVPLTLYTAHVLAVTAYPASTATAPTVLAWHLTVAVAVGVLLRLAGRRGPLEWVVGAAGRVTRSAVGAVGTPTARP